jgi:translation initiation factor 2B subunit (eIF-2B alpha/beta/delta family)
MAIPEVFQPRLEEIRKDRASGAAKLTLVAATVLIECAQTAPESVGEVALELTGAQPAMGPIFNLTRRVLKCSDVLATCGEFLESMEHSAALVAGNAAALIQDGMTVMTHSFSSTVREACRQAYRQGRRFSAICPESRPVCEGVAMAASLGAQGIQATVIADAAIYRCLPGVQLVWVGADAISSRGVFNKTGTSLLALAAHERGVPVYVLCSSDKFLPASYEPPPEEPKNPHEILERELPHVAALNYYFDLTPLALLTGVVTEEGILTQGALREKLEAL